MSRNLRTRRLPEKKDPKTNPVVKNAVKPSKGREEKKKNETETKRASALRDKTNLSNEMIKSTEKNESKEQNKSAELPEGRKRSSRLRTEKSEGVNEKKESISGTNETENLDSGPIRTETRLRKRNKSQENDLSDKKQESDKKPTQNKFFKSKRPGVDSGRPIIQSQRIAAKKNGREADSKPLEKKESLGYVGPLRQTTLSESFGRGSLRARLRPRKNAKDYKDSSSISMLVENSISPEKRKSVIVLERIDESKTNKEPVYKAVSKMSDKSSEDKDSVYDFQFDRNDPSEKPAGNKNRRKKAIRKQTVTRRKKKTVLLPKIDKIEEKKADKILEKDEIQSENKTDDDKVEKTPIQIENTGETEADKVLEPQEAPTSPQNLNPMNKLEDKGPRAKICSVETLTGDRKVSFMPNPSLSRINTTKFNPFRSTQSIFRPRSTMHAKDMMDHSLLNKSLSPIKGDVEPFDPASPWRPPLPHSFSSVRKIFQSTPQAKKSFMRTGQGFTIDENEENDENTGENPTQSPKPADKKTVNPLGVRSTNAENIQACYSRKNEAPLTQETNSKVFKPTVAKNPLGVASGYGENRQNSGYGDRLYISPKKSEMGSPGPKRRKNPLGPRGAEDAENLAPRTKGPIPEDGENSQPKEELKLMRQSNLNTFLNLDDMPESIRINTSHGIFGDENPAALVTKNNQTPNTPIQANIENCFGFDEDCSDVQLSPKKFEKKGPTPVKNMFQRFKRRVLPKEKQPTARISLGEIKNTLYPRKEPRNVEKAEQGNGAKKDAVSGVEKEPRNKNNNTKAKDAFNPVQFSDTFDVLSESEQAGSERARDDGKSDGNEFALFADLEPVHFTKPPRWSYAKKRDRKQYWTSDDEDKEDEDVRDEPVLKKRKLVKLNKVEEKKIDEWVKSVNETFQEIDDFDLVVEKLS